MTRWRLTIGMAAGLAALAGCTPGSGGSPSVESSPGATLSPGATASPTLGVPGSPIVFGEALEGSEPSLVIMADDGAKHQLDAAGCPACAHWSPGGDRLLLAAETSDEHIPTATVNPDGSGYTELPVADPTINLGPGAWSPDGTRIASEGWDDSDLSRAGIYTGRSSDGSDLIRVTRTPGRRYDIPLAYSPNGARMLFFRGGEDETGDLFVVDADGTGLRQLNGGRTTVRNVFGVSPADWSPDGRGIVFASGAGDGRSAVFVVGADGGHRRRITPWGPWTTSAHWSPDGRRIVYDKINDLSGSHDLFLVNADGTEPTAITSTTDGYGSCCAVWAPDGSKLLFLRASAGGQYDLWVVSPDGTGLGQLTDTAGTEEGYSWAPKAQARS